MLTEIQGLAGKQHTPGSSKYEEVRQQYATSTHQKDRLMTPGLIVQAKGMDDVIRTVKYAKEHKKSVAVRSGGHMFGGLSSTGRANIQLDMASTFRKLEDQTITKGPNGETLVRTSVSQDVGEFNAYLKANKLFVPHGNNAQVRLGGHVQTGGYGQLIRSFGLLGDHVASFELVDHNGTIKEVTKESNPDLFYAVLGGSPGNFGVLTHITFAALKDSDYAESHGLKVEYEYSPQTLQRLLNILVAMSDDEDFPRNYDLTVNLTNNRLVVYAQFVPLTPTDKPNLSWFTSLNTASTPLETTGIQFLPLSQLTTWWLSTSTSNPSLPYVNRLQTTSSTSLAEKNWASWIVSRIETARAHPAGLIPNARFQCVGGAASQLYANANNGTAFSWRDTTALALLECFHEPEAKDVAEEWQRVNELEGVGREGVFAEGDRRLLWCPNGDYNMEGVWRKYFEDEGKFERLGRVRAEADPYGTFTSNAFAVRRVDGVREGGVGAVALKTGVEVGVVEKVEKKALAVN